MTTPLQQAAQQALKTLESGALLCELTAASMLRVALEADQAANSRIGFLYEELRKATDGGSESMTHDDALKQIAYWQDKEQAQAVEPYGWMIQGVPTVMRGSLAQQIQEGEARRIGGACKAFPVFTRPAPPPAGESYDQQALELCGECGWKAIMPGEPCFVCNMQTEAQQVPMTTKEALDLMPTNNMGRLDALAWMARAVERHHGIGVNPAAKQVAAPTGCRRSHPHEEMNEVCKLKTEIAQLKAALRASHTELIHAAAWLVLLTPLRKMQELDELKQIGHRQFGRALALTEDALKLKAIEIRRAADALVTKPDSKTDWSAA